MDEIKYRNTKSYIDIRDIRYKTVEKHDSQHDNLIHATIYSTQILMECLRVRPGA
jgi:hypothetical protein